jgi:hypothetical protein
MDHLFLVDDITKDSKNPTILSKQVKEAREQYKTRALDVGMSETRFQEICDTRYIIRRFLSVIHVEYPNRILQIPIHSVRGTENHQVRDTTQPLYIAVTLLPPFWINVEYLLQNTGDPENCVADSHPVKSSSQIPKKLVPRGPSLGSSCLSTMPNALEFRATVHTVWKIIKTETLRNLVAEMYLCMVLKCTNNEVRVLITSMCVVVSHVYPCVL